MFRLTSVTVDIAGITRTCVMTSFTRPNDPEVWTLAEPATAETQLDRGNATGPRKHNSPAGHESSRACSSVTPTGFEPVLPP